MEYNTNKQKWEKIEEENKKKVLSKKLKKILFEGLILDGEKKQ